jgi:hypothetical protein
VPSYDIDIDIESDRAASALRSEGGFMPERR